MIANLSLEKFDNQKYIEKDELIEAIKNQLGYDNDASIRWKIYDLIRSKKITRIDNKHFFNGYLKTYRPSIESEIKINLECLLKKKFPSLEIIVFESTILNEWINHQISKNIIIVQVERYYLESVFNLIKENIETHVLLEPSLNDFYLYAENNTIVVSSMITRSPRNLNDYDIRLEKLIVDVFSNDLIKEFINPDEIESLASEVFSKYRINIKTLLSYAKRRLLYDNIYKYIESYIPKGSK